MPLSSSRAREAPRSSRPTANPNSATLSNQRLTWVTRVERPGGSSRHPDSRRETPGAGRSFSLMFKRSLAALAMLVAAGCDHDEKTRTEPYGYSSYSAPHGYTAPASDETFITTETSTTARSSQPIGSSNVRVEWGPVRSSREGGGTTIEPSSTRQPSTSTPPTTRQPSTAAPSTALSESDRDFITKA